jgi:hypothetical protein
MKLCKVQPLLRLTALDKGRARRSKILGQKWKKNPFLLTRSRRVTGDGREKREKLHITQLHHIRLASVSTRKKKHFHPKWFRNIAPAAVLHLFLLVLLRAWSS